MGTRSKIESHWQVINQPVCSNLNVFYILKIVHSEITLFKTGTL